MGKYQLVAEIARGGMGIVYLAIAQGPARFSKLLVVKELKPEFVEDDAFLEMFLEEARLAARLSHRNIVQTYEVGEENRRHYIVMDYLDGVTLARLLRRKSPNFTRNMHLRVICEILQGLHYAHTLKDFDGSDLGVVHRDVTPQNVFVTFDGQAKIVDFGIAKALDSSIETRTGVLKGKPAYMAPEQIGGDVDPRADVFSAGVMIWEAIAGQRMWAKKGDVEVLANMLKGDVPSIREQVPDVPDELARIVERALLKDRDERYPSAAALQKDLEAFLASDPHATMRDVGVVVSEIFEEERTATRATIDGQLALLKAGAAPADRPPSWLPSGEHRVTPTGRPIDRAVVSSGETPAGAAISMQQPPNISVPPDTSGTSKRAPLYIGMAALLLTAIGFALGMSATSKKEPTTIATAATSGTATTTPANPTTEPPPSIASVNPAPPPPATPDPVPARVAEKPPEKPVERPRVTWTPPPRPAWTPPPRVAAPPVKPNPTPTAAAPETKAPDDDGKGKTGYLTLDTYPWTRVSLGGRVLGDTPIVRLPLAAGTHVLTLENTAENVKKTTVVTIKAGETVSKRLAF